MHLPLCSFKLQRNSRCWSTSRNAKVEDGDEEYDFNYEDEDNEEPDVDLENKYYNAKGVDFLNAWWQSVDRIIKS